MLDLRFAKKEDNALMKKMWQDIFSDSKEFVDWFFEERFYPHNSVLAFKDNNLVSALHSLDIHVNVRGVNLKSTFISGVATYPEYRRQGFMNKIFSYYLEEIQKKSVFISYLKADYIPTYYALGYYPVTDSAYVSMERIKREIEIEANNLKKENKKKKDYTVYSKKIKDLSLEEIKELRKVYDNFAKNFSNIILRDTFEFQRKLRDYGADQAKCMIQKENDMMQAYCIYYEEEDVYVEEFISSNPKDTKILIEALEGLDKSLKIKMSKKIAQETKLDNIEILPQNSMNIINVEKFLESVLRHDNNWLGKEEENNKAYSAYTLKVKDSFLPQNTGIYNLLGERLDDSAPYHFEIDSYYLGQLISGYRSLEQLRELNLIDIKDHVACKEINLLLPALDTFMVEEY